MLAPCDVVTACCTVVAACRYTGTLGATISASKLVLAGQLKWACFQAEHRYKLLGSRRCLDPAPSLSMIVCPLVEDEGSLSHTSVTALALIALIVTLQHFIGHPCHRGRPMGIAFAMRVYEKTAGAHQALLINTPAAQAVSFRGSHSLALSGACCALYVHQSQA